MIARGNERSKLLKRFGVRVIRIVALCFDHPGVNQIVIHPETQLYRRRIIGSCALHSNTHCVLARIIDAVLRLRHGQTDEPEAIGFLAEKIRERLRRNFDGQRPAGEHLRNREITFCENGRCRKQVTYGVETTT